MRIDLTLRGDHDAAAPYFPGEVATVAGKPYLCLAPNAGEDPASSAHWAVWPAAEGDLASAAPQIAHHAAPASLLQDLEEARYQLALLRMRGTGGVQTLGPFAVFI